MPNIINIISIVLFLLFWFLIIRKMILSRLSPVKNVKAEVVDKYKSKPATKHPGIQNEIYTVIFKTTNKKLSFRVSEFTYGDYHVGEKGTLKYKGSRIISFD